MSPSSVAITTLVVAWAAAAAGARNRAMASANRWSMVPTIEIAARFAKSSLRWHRFVRKIEPRPEGGAVEHEVAQAIAVEMGEKRLERSGECRLQSTDAVYRTAAFGERETADERVEPFEPADHIADANLPWGLRKLQPPAASAYRFDQTLRLKVLRNLGKMVARDAVAASDFVDGQPLPGNGERHQNAQGIVAVEAQLHERGISNIAFMSKPIKSEANKKSGVADEPGRHVEPLVRSRG